MTNLNRRKFLTGATALGVAATFGGAAIAQEPAAHIEEDNSPWIQAAKWARQNDGIAIHVDLGSDSGHPASAIEQFFENGFRQGYGVEAEAFVEQSDSPGTVVSYFYRDAALKPVPFDVATSQEKLDSVVAQYNGEEVASISLGTADPQI